MLGTRASLRALGRTKVRRGEGSSCDEETDERGTAPSSKASGAEQYGEVNADANAFATSLTSREALTQPAFHLLRPTHLHPALPQIGRAHV